MQQKYDDPKVERIIRWRETLSTMNEERFFEIMRIYIGEVHTPYNKDKLIEQLSSIFRKEQNKERIVSYLTTFDIKIISAVSAVKNATKEKIIDFFKNEYPLSEIYSELLNLNERLIIYSYKNDDEQTILEINPLLEEALAPFENVNRLLPAPVYGARNFDAPFCLTPQFISSFLSYIYENPDMCKNNSSIKKKDLEHLEEIFPGKEKCIQLLLSAFLNLRMIRQGEKDLSVDESRWKSFASHPELLQYAYLSTASVARLGREGLRSQSQLLLDIAASLPPEGLTRSSILRLAFLISNKTEDNTNAPVQSRFSRMIANHRSDSTFEFSGALIEQILDSAVEFGLFSVSGYSETEEPILTAGIPVLNQNIHTEQGNKKGILNINAGTSITILPGLTLSELLPIVQFLNIKNCSTVTEFEITRKSVSRAFDKNISTEQVLYYLELYNAYKIPQSLEINIQEWHNSYSSAILYKGYVLKVDESSERVVENNPKIKPHIQLKLAPGIFLLNIPLSEDADSFIKNSGLDFMGNVKTAVKESEMVVFPQITRGKNFMSSLLSEEEQQQLESQELKTSQNAQKFKEELLSKLQQMELTEQQLECLSTRIQRGVILNEEQLKPETVRMEILEAEGLNYSGKIHLIENAINAGDLVQFTMPSETNPETLITFLGKPLMIARQTSDSLVKVQLQTDNPEQIGEIRFYSLSRVNHIKIIRTSIFR